MRQLRAFAGVAALVAVSGCVINVPGPGGGPAPQRGAEGTWGDAGGVATATLQNGSFTSVANDTGNRVAEGNYRYAQDGTIEISYYSILRQTQIRANCVLATRDQLNCTNDGGQQFSLFRRSAIT